MKSNLFNSVTAQSTLHSGGRVLINANSIHSIQFGVGYIFFRSFYRKIPLSLTFNKINFGKFWKYKIILLRNGIYRAAFQIWWHGRYWIFVKMKPKMMETKMKKKIVHRKSNEMNSMGVWQMCVSFTQNSFGSNVNNLAELIPPPPHRVVCHWTRVYNRFKIHEKKHF